MAPSAKTAAVKSPADYEGEYVGLKSFSSKTVVTHGKKLVAVFKQAQKMGVKNPVVYFVPRKNAINLF
jgi:hypothetical protein